MGIHLHLGKLGAVRALDALMAEFPEITDVQIFTHGPQSSKAVKLDSSLPARVAHYGLRLWTHGSYLCVPWSRDKPWLARHALENVRVSHAIGSRCVVLHIPFAPVETVVAGIVPLVRQMRDGGLCGTRLMLETSATRADPTRSYESPEKLNRLTTALLVAGLGDCVSICVDTAHIFTGRAQISSYAEGVAYCTALDTRLLGMIQLNGNSIDPSVASHDKHEIPMSPEDLIWRGRTWATAGCRAFVELAQRLRIPIILEVNPRHSASSIRTFLDAAKGLARDGAAMQT